MKFVSKIIIFNKMKKALAAHQKSSKAHRLRNTDLDSLLREHTQDNSLKIL